MPRTMVLQGFGQISWSQATLAVAPPSPQAEPSGPTRAPAIATTFDDRDGAVDDGDAAGVDRRRLHDVVLPPAAGRGSPDRRCNVARSSLPSRSWSVGSDTSPYPQACRFPPRPQGLRC